MKHQVCLLFSLLLSLVMSGAALQPANAQTVTYTGDTSANGTSRFQRPQSFTDLSSLATSVPYQTYTFRPTAAGNFRIRSVAGNWDNFVLVYSGSFNPSSPLVNLIAYNDDANNSESTTSLIPSIAFAANTDYIIVTTGSQNSDKGAYTNTIGPAIVNGDTTGGATFARPDSNNSVDPGQPLYPVNILSTSATAVRYQAKTFSVTQAGLYRIQSESLTPGFDPFTILYKGTFDPANPLNNALIANDDFGTLSISGFDIGLEANQTYTLVTTGSTNTDAGQYFYSYQKLYDFRAGFSGSTVARSGIDISSLSTMFDPPLSNAGNAVPFRAFRVSTAAGGFFRFQLFSKTFSANAYNPFLLLYSPLFDNSAPDTNLDQAYYNSPLLDTGDLNFDAATSTIFVVSGYKNTDAGDFRLEAFGDAAVTITPVAVVKGSVTLKTFLDSPPPAPRSFPVRITFRPVGGGGDTVVNTTVSSSGGSYLANVPEGTFNVGFKSLTLQKVVSNVNTTSGVVTGVNGTALLGADSNDDNFTDINDLLVLINSYNQVRPSAGYNALADYNFDGVIDINDLLILIGSYNQSGQFLP